MEPYIITFRILHIMAALAWFGASFMFEFFIEPTARALGPGAERFMTHLSKERKLSQVITVIALVTLIAGGFLYWRDSSGFDVDWITSDVGLGLTVGSIAAVVAFGIGATLIGPNVRRMGKLGEEIGAAGGAPTEAQMAAMGRIQERVKTSGRVSFGFLVIAALAMSTARYLNF